MSLTLGVYDYNATFSQASDLGYDHYFASWLTGKEESGSGRSSTSLCQLSVEHNRYPVVTVQPWADPSITSYGHDYLVDVGAGAYDQYIMGCIEQFKAYGGPFVLRTMHEMDLPGNQGRYDWAVDSSRFADWVRAYQRIIGLFKSYIHHQEWHNLWSPGGSNYSGARNGTPRKVQSVRRSWRLECQPEASSERACKAVAARERKRAEKIRVA